MLLVNYGGSDAGLVLSQILVLFFDLAVFLFDNGGLSGSCLLLFVCGGLHVCACRVVSFVLSSGIREYFMIIIGLALI
jgi:hypothetical protein